MSAEFRCQAEHTCCGSWKVSMSHLILFRASQDFWADDCVPLPYVWASVIGRQVLSVLYVRRWLSESTFFFFFGGYWCAGFPLITNPIASLSLFWLFFFFFLLFDHALGMWKFPGQEWNPHHSSNNAKSLTHCTTKEFWFLSKLHCSSYIHPLCQWFPNHSYQKPLKSC